MTFRSFLKGYCKYLTDAPDFRLRSFSNGLNDNYRALPVVLLYAVAYLPKEKFFYEELNSKNQKEYDQLSLRLQNYNSVEEMCQKDDELAWEYKRVYKAYLDTFKLKEVEKETKKYFCGFFKKMFGLKKVSKYRVCKDLKLNQSNLNDFLKGKLDHLSLDKCYEVEGYLKGKLTG